MPDTDTLHQHASDMGLPGLTCPFIIFFPDTLTLSLCEGSGSLFQVKPQVNVAPDTTYCY